MSIVLQYADFANIYMISYDNDDKLSICTQVSDPETKSELGDDDALPRN